MDDVLLKVAMAAYFHDIGKFLDAELLGIDVDFRNTNAPLYQPKHDGRYTHNHVLGTVAFIEKFKELLPRELSSRHWGSGDTFLNLAARHHDPSTPLEMIIAMADRLSSGHDREKQTVQEPAKTNQDYKSVRLLPILEQLTLSDSPRVSRPEYQYPLEILSADSIFPIRLEDAGKKDKSASRQEYVKLSKGFLNALKELVNRDKIALWFEHFDSLMMTHTWCIPQDRSGKVIPDSSLYDHLLATSALASAAYLFHKETDSLIENDIRNNSLEKYLFVTGDFYGIQNFIFASHGDTRKNRSKLLRGRSFMVSLFIELAADIICRELGLPFTSVVFKGAGKFTLIAPNTDKARESIRRLDSKVNDWLIDISYGESTLGISTIKAAGNDLIKGSFADLWDKMTLRVESKKHERIDLNKHGGVIGGYLDRFNNDLPSPLCPLCGKRPSAAETLNDSVLGQVSCSCLVCRDHTYLGSQLVKNNYIGILHKSGGEPGGLLKPIFDEYSVEFGENSRALIHPNKNLLRLWNIALHEGKVPNDAASRFINGYIPVFTGNENRDPRLENIKSSARREELLGQVVAGDPKTFSHLALSAQTSEADKPKGTDAIGVLKMDVDNLGALFAAGLTGAKMTISRMATLSRQLDFFFSIYLKDKLQTNVNYQNVYTIFAGGDDLFVLGPWNKIIELAVELRMDFRRYVGHNPDISFSAGICLHKPNVPMDRLAESAEEALAKAKEGDKNQLVAFGEAVSWDKINQLLEIKNDLEDRYDQCWINNSFLYKLNHFIDLAGRAKVLLDSGVAYMDDSDCLKWRPLLSYSIIRNTGKNLDKNKRRDTADSFLVQLINWLDEFGSAAKIPLWVILYNNR